MLNVAQLNSKNIVNHATLIANADDRDVVNMNVVDVDHPEPELNNQHAV